MPGFCVAVNCSSRKHLFSFPRGQPELLRKWVKFVQQKRADFATPTLHSTLCKDHFVDSDFQNMTEYEMGFAKKLLLNKGAVPTVHKKLACKSSSKSTTPQAELTEQVVQRRMKSATKRNAFRRLQTLENSPPEQKQLTLHEPAPTHRTVSEVSEEAWEPTCEQQQQLCCACQCHRRHVVLTTFAGTQTSSQGINKECQTDFADTFQRMQCEVEEEEEEEEEGWLMSSEVEEETDDDELESEGGGRSDEDNVPEPVTERKFIVFESCLKDLLRSCPTCMTPCHTDIKTVGSAIIVTRKCTSNACGESSTWHSQPKIRQIYQGNLLMSAAILFSGSLARKVLHFLDTFGINRISASTHFRHQKLYLHATVQKVWQLEQKGILAELRSTGQPLVLAGDGRCDSPGHSAKYGGYNVLECNIKKIIDVQVVQSNEVSSSNACELEGLKRSMTFLAEQDLTVQTVITDRHRSVAKFLREKHPGVTHYYDTWHVSKALGKKLDALTLRKGCELIGAWRRSITNHLHWCAASTPDGNGKVILAKWNSLANHVANIHEGHGTEYPKCSHGDIEDNDVEWFDPATGLYDKLTQILEDKNLVKDIQKLSPLHQTSSLEAFHSLIISFAPKSTAFSYLGMRSRLCLAALHYNENADKQPLTDSAGNVRYAVYFTKAKKGGYSIRKKQQPASYAYTRRLLDYLMDAYAKSPNYLEASLSDIVQYIPSSLCASFQHPTQAEAVQRMTRFATNS